MPELTFESIIAIHGLNGDRVKTWTDGDVFWLQDLLPNTLKARGIKARIFSYGYNADAYSSSEVSIQDLWGLGEAFLSAVVSQRRLDDVSYLHLMEMIDFSETRIRYLIDPLSLSHIP